MCVEGGDLRVPREDPEMVFIKRSASVSLANGPPLIFFFPLIFCIFLFTSLISLLYDIPMPCFKNAVFKTIFCLVTPGELVEKYISALLGIFSLKEQLEMISSAGWWQGWSAHGRPCQSPLAKRHWRGGRQSQVASTSSLPPGCRPAPGEPRASKHQSNP